MNTPFLPVPYEPERCSCGNRLTMEMEHDKGTCVQCQFEIAMGVRLPPFPSIRRTS